MLFAYYILHMLSFISVFPTQKLIIVVATLILELMNFQVYKGLPPSKTTGIHAHNFF
jgi:hypothetical protein